MKLRPLGSTGLHVSSIGLGGMPLSLESRPAKSEAIKVIHAALRAGVTLIDTADVYCIDHAEVGHNEKLIAAALDQWPDPESVVVATKGGLTRPGGAWVTDAHPRRLKAACEASLKALKIPAIALYQLHAVDDVVPLEDSVGALAELRRAGKIMHIGLSNVTAAQIRRAQQVAPIVSVQNRCGVFDRRDFNNGVIPLCEAEKIAYLAYSPVGGSRGKHRVTDDPTLRRIAANHGVSPFQIALAWLLARSPVIVPIPGASKITSAIDSAAAGALELSSDDIAALEQAFPLAQASPSAARAV
ncbi:aldo/keto reductase [Nannocystis pusilla]|uniref:Aldo/keto reductase n=1 Tax=Nannocystis pusilla TaxID=889268 RepID=A0ABS7TZ85_9BACT|nr:aldo/keto reductase [Nannocystis pusilla]MBZ5713588.1 aldo/keto reductase [Nannocystis pusilla]